jgi:hypothetical protein
MEQEYGEGAGEDTDVEKTVFTVGNEGRYMWRTGENPGFQGDIGKTERNTDEEKKGGSSMA